MAEDFEPVLLRWSQHVQLSDVQDPLGLGLRGSARLASQLLHCITSMTPRARYFSFIPWCILDHQKRGKGSSQGLGLREAIVLRERALTLGCVAYHGGQPCKGGGLIGTREAGNWFSDGHAEADFRILSFAKVPALDAYYNSLVNLGCIVIEEEMEDTDDGSQSHEMTFDDIELTPLGQQLAEAYGSQISSLASVHQLSERQRMCSVRDLGEWGERGGLCELAENSAPDRRLLRDIFLALIEQKGESHPVRKQSLLLILELCRQLSAIGWHLDESTFSSATYYGETVNDDSLLKVEWSSPLSDIAIRWRMFYFHHFMSVALEGLFSWLISQLSDKGLSGATVESLVDGLDSTTVRSVLEDEFGVNAADQFGASCPADFFALFGLTPAELNTETSRQLDDRITPDSRIAEIWLEDLIRRNSYLQSSAGLAVPMVLLALTLGRYTHWQETRFGNWLAGTAHDPYLDLIPPILTDGLTRRFGDWWRCSWKELADFVMCRYVIRQHIAMSYEKTATGDRCLLQTDGEKVVSSANYDEIGIGNPRFPSAVQILKDLALLDDTNDGITVLTEEGDQLLDSELEKGNAE